jgi:hypothetical protein
MVWAAGFVWIFIPSFLKNLFIWAPIAVFSDAWDEWKQTVEQFDFKKKDLEL